MNPPLDYDPKSDFDRTTHLDPLTGWRYLQISNPEDFDEIVEQTIKKTPAEIVQDKVAETPIYYDLDANLFYYPRCAIYEILDQQRVIIVGKPPLKYDEDGEIWRNQYGEYYLEVMDNEEFNGLRAVQLREREEKAKRVKAKQTPIYLDPKSGEYYYPLLAAREPERYSRDILKMKLPLLYDETEKMYYDPSTSEKYVLIINPLKFEILRQLIQSGKNPPKQRPPIIPRTQKKLKHLRQLKTLEFKIAIDTPIYFDIENNKYYYPEIAAMEAKQIPRRTIPENPLIFDEYRDCFIDPSTGERYRVMVDGIEEVREACGERKLRVRELLEERARKTPIYFDPEKREYYYPDIQTYELEELPRDVVKGEPPLNFDPRNNIYRDQNAEPYILIQTTDELKRLKEKRLSNRYRSAKHPGPEDTPIYHDPLTRHLFYPNTAFLEPQERSRVMLEQKPSLVFVDKLFALVHTKSGEEYMELESVDEFYRLRHEVGKRKKTVVEVESKESLQDDSIVSIQVIQSSKGVQRLNYTKIKKEFESLVIETPVYHWAGKWFYPELALYEKVEVKRKVLEVDPPLGLNRHDGGYYDRVNNEKYFVVATPEEFAERKELCPTLNLREILTNR